MSDAQHDNPRPEVTDIPERPDGRGKLISYLISCQRNPSREMFQDVIHLGMKIVEKEIMPELEVKEMIRTYLNGVTAFDVECGIELIGEGTKPDRRIFAPRKGKEQSEEKGRIKTFTVAELLAKDFPAPKEIIPGFVYAGVTLVTGDPKAGKTRKTQGAAIALATGGVAWGKIHVSKIKVFVLMLEGGEARYQKLLSDMDCPGDASLTYRTDWPQGAKGFEALEQFITENPDVELIIIDTWCRFAGIDDYNDYATTTDALGKFGMLFDKYRVNFLLVHHSNKRGDVTDFVQSVLGSQGIAASVDTLMILKKERGTGKVKCYITGRDIDDGEYVFSWASELAGWELEGRAEEVQKTPERQVIFDMLKDCGPLSPIDVWQKLHDMGDKRKPDTIRSLLWKMSKQGKLYQKNGLYSVLPPLEYINNVNSINSDNTVNSVNATADDSVAAFTLFTPLGGNADEKQEIF